MKCKDCLYNENCELKEFAKDITGCEGRSKERLPKKDEVKCSHCNSWIHLSKALKHRNNDVYLCFECY